MKIPALCPECGGTNKDCNQCKGTGLIEVEFFSKGFFDESKEEKDDKVKLYTHKCTDDKCGFENGGRLAGGPDYPPLPATPHIDCVMCGAPAYYLEIK